MKLADRIRTSSLLAHVSDQRDRPPDEGARGSTSSTSACGEPDFDTPPSREGSRQVRHRPQLTRYTANEGTLGVCAPPSSRS
jgi:hypothetical protein